MTSAVAAFTLSACVDDVYKYPARQATAVGIDYPRAARRARAGDQAALITLFRVTANLDGLGAEEHSSELQELLRHYGDAQFAALLRRENRAIRQNVVDSLDFAFLVYTRDRCWFRTFPLTYSLGRHPVLRESHTRGLTKRCRHVVRSRIAL